MRNVESGSRWMWQEIVFPRPMESADAVERMRRMADDPAAPLFALEVRATGGRVQYLLGAEAAKLSRLALSLGVTAVTTTIVREPVTTTRALRVSTLQRGFAADDLTVSTAGILTALTHARSSELLVLQLVFGARLRGLPVPSRPEVSRSAWAHLSGAPTRRPDHGDQQARVRKQEQPGFRSIIRLGVAAETPQRRRVLLMGVFAALRRLETPGVTFQLTNTRPMSLDTARSPWRWPLTISVTEAAALTALPVGDGNLPGLPPLHPRALAPVQALPKLTTGRIVVGEPTAPGVEGKLSLSIPAVLRGVHLQGPPGVGKSDLLANLAVQWINQGNAAVVMEPKSDLSANIVTRIDPEHRDRIVYVDLTDEQPVGLNPLRAGGRDPELVTDGLVTIFAEIFSDVLGVRTRDVIHAALLTLVQYPGATLVMLPRLLTDRAFRRQVLAKVPVDPFLQAFWVGFEARSEQASAQVIEPVLSRLRPVLLRRTLRASLGQSHPRFDVRDIFGPEKKVLIVPLPEAQLGREGAALYGALLLQEVFTAVKERALVAPERRHPVMIAVDEFQTYLRHQDDFREALAIFRGYGCGLVLANQLLGQLPTELRSVVHGAIRSRIYFQLAPEDARDLARFTPELDAVDFVSLPSFHIYASLFDHGQSQPFVSGRTLRLPPPLTRVRDVKVASRERYGVSARDTEAAFTSSPAMNHETPDDTNHNDDITDEIGRRRRRTP